MPPKRTRAQTPRKPKVDLRTDAEIARNHAEQAEYNSIRHVSEIDPEFAATFLPGTMRDLSGHLEPDIPLDEIGVNSTKTVLIQCPRCGTVKEKTFKNATAIYGRGISSGRGTSLGCGAYCGQKVKDVPRLAKAIIERADDGSGTVIRTNDVKELSSRSVVLCTFKCQHEDCIDIPTQTFDVRIANIAKNKAIHCPQHNSMSKGEALVLEMLELMVVSTPNLERIFRNNRGNRREIGFRLNPTDKRDSRWDFLVLWKGIIIAIEVDGIQHFDTSRWSRISVSERYRNMDVTTKDIDKEMFAVRNGISVLRLHAQSLLEMGKSILQKPDKYFARPVDDGNPSKSKRAKFAEVERLYTKDGFISESALVTLWTGLEEVRVRVADNEGLPAVVTTHKIYDNAKFNYAKKVNKWWADHPDWEKSEAERAILEIAKAKAEAEAKAKAEASKAEAEAEAESDTEDGGVGESKGDDHEH
jgi:hypothetical protein